MSEKKSIVRLSEKFNSWLMERLNVLIFLFVVFLSVLFIIQIAVFTYNGWSLSHDMSDWQNFATVISLIPASFSFMFLLYTFHIQNKQNQKENFCDQLHSYLGIQRDLYKKTENNLFFYMHWFIGEVLNKFTADELNREIIADTYEKFYELYSEDKRCPVQYSKKDMNDLRNYFKFLFHIVSFVNDADEQIISDAEKIKYIMMIQAQMSNDELYCYMINVLDYYYRVDAAQKDDKAYIFILDKYDFFKDIFQKKSDTKLLSANSKVHDFFYNEFGHCEKSKEQQKFSKFPFKKNGKIIKTSSDL